MSSAPGRHRRLRWLAIGLLLSAMAAGAAWLSRPEVVVGRDWPPAECVPCRSIAHPRWSELLGRYVDAQGNVDYAGWKNSPSDVRQLDEYLDELSRLDPDAASDSACRLAYWINAYNAVTIRGIIREYPTTSIQNHVHYGWGYNIWRDLKLKVCGSHWSLGQMEHDILRQFDEPAIHFAIVCASRGCPRLRQAAYTAERLTEQLDENATAFFADSTKCSFATEHNTISLSRILQWYAGDFGATPDEQLQQIARWLPADIRAAATAKNVRIVFLDYDWSLNEQLASPLPPPE